METKTKFSKKAIVIISILLVMAFVISVLFINGLKISRNKAISESSQKAKATVAIYLSKKEIEFLKDCPMYFLEYGKTYYTVKKVDDGYTVELCGTAKFMWDSEYFESKHTTKSLSFTSKVNVSKNGTSEITYLSVHGKTIKK